MKPELAEHTKPKQDIQINNIVSNLSQTKIAESQVVEKKYKYRYVVQKSYNKQIQCIFLNKTLFLILLFLGYC